MTTARVARARSSVSWSSTAGRRNSIAEMETQGVLNPEITDGEPLLIEGNVTWDPTCESAVGSANPPCPSAPTRRRKGRFVAAACRIEMRISHPGAREPPWRALDGLGFQYECYRVLRLPLAGATQQPMPDLLPGFSFAEVTADDSRPQQRRIDPRLRLVRGTRLARIRDPGRDRPHRLPAVVLVRQPLPERVVLALVAHGGRLHAPRHPPRATGTGVSRRH